MFKTLRYIFQAKALIVVLSQVDNFPEVIKSVFILEIGALKIVDKIVGLRVEHKEELQGLDLSQHGESGYRF